jgi:hypothetical protein
MVLKLAQRFLVRLAPLLECGPSLDESGQLTLKLVVSLLAGGSLLPKLFLRRGERDSLVLLGLFSPSDSSSATWPRWSWAQAATTSASHVDARECTPCRSSQARRSASSRSSNAIHTLTTA